MFRSLLAWQHVVGGEVPASATAFGAGTPFILGGVPLASDALRLEGGVEMPVGPAAILGLDYSGLFASGVQDHGLKAKFAVRF